ncbi:MAG: TlpA disulfide reductase family protein [Pseudomonadota bacterium]
MRLRPLTRPVAAFLYGAAVLAAIPAATMPSQALAGEAAAAETLSAGAVEEIREMASSALPKMVVHDTPRGPYTTPFEDGEGNPVALTRFEGKVVVLNFWATWCPPCRAEMPTLDNLSKKMKGSDVEVVALSTDRGGAPKVEGFYASTGNPDHPVIRHLDIYVDYKNKMPREAALLGLPVTVILDRQGREIARLSGDAHWDGHAVVSLLRRIAELTEGTVRDAAVAAGSAG